VEKRISITQCHGGNEYPNTVKRRKGNGIGHSWRRDCHLKYGKGEKEK